MLLVVQLSVIVESSAIAESPVGVATGTVTEVSTLRAPSPAPFTAEIW